MAITPRTARITPRPNAAHPWHPAAITALYIVAMATIAVGSIYLFEHRLVKLFVTLIELFLVVSLVKAIYEVGYRRGCQWGYQNGVSHERRLWNTDCDQAIREKESQP